MRKGTAMSYRSPCTTNENANKRRDFFPMGGSEVPLHIEGGLAHRKIALLLITSGQSPAVMHFLQPVNRRRNSFHAGFQLQREKLRIVPRLMQIAAMKPQCLLLRRLPHVALLAFPRA